ncbi:MAG: electron transport complex subunit E [Clostridia bacterium]|nr:electron transport complex subunit E [Clostridia bacterium]
MKNNNLSILLKGLIKENPVFVLVLGTCPTLAITTNVVGAFGMGIAALVVLICSNVLISLLRKVIPETVRIPCYIVVIAGFVTIVQMVVHAFFPALYDMLGVYLPLITVNCIILGRAEMFAGKNTVGKSALDGIGMGLGFTIALLCMSTIREVFGAASFAGMEIPFLEPYKIEFLTKAPGGMLVFGLMIALVYVITKGKAPMRKSFSCAACPNAANCQTGCSEAASAVVDAAPAAETEKGDA